MLSRVASRVSMRSRERKLQLFLELLQPGPASSVVDVGVTDAPFGGGSTDNFFEALYPWPARRDGGRADVARPVHGRVPERDRGAGGRPRPAVRRRRLRPRVLERGRRACRRPRPSSGASCTSSAALRGASSSRRRIATSRSRCTRWCRSPTGCRVPPRDRVLRARGFDDILEPLGPKELASLFPYSVRVVNTGMTLIAVGPR